MKPELYSKRTFKKEVLRKTLHLPVFLFPLLTTYDLRSTLILLITLMVGYVGIFFLQQKWGIRIFILSDTITLLSRNHALDLSPLLMSFGLFIAICIGIQKQSYFPAYCLAICDSAAALIGTRFGRHKIKYLSKTWEGSFAFFLTCFVGTLFIFDLPQALISALLLTLIEALSEKGIDNLFLPIVAQIFINHFQ